MIVVEDTSIEWGRKELQRLRGHLERVRRRGAENKKYLFWTLVVGLLVNNKCLLWLPLAPTVRWGKNVTPAVGLEIVLSRDGCTWKLATVYEGPEGHKRLKGRCSHAQDWLQFHWLGVMVGVWERGRTPCCPLWGEQKEMCPWEGPVGSSDQARKEVGLQSVQVIRFCSALFQRYSLETSPF